MSETAETYTFDTADVPPVPLRIIGKPNEFVLGRQIDIEEKVVLPPLLEALGRADYQMWIRLNPTGGRTLPGYVEAIRQHTEALKAVAAEVAEIARLQNELDAVEDGDQ